VSLDIEIEKSLVAAFVTPRKRDRYRALLESRKGRDRFRRSLAHFSDWDPRFASKIHAANPSELHALLRRVGAPTDCYVLSEDDRYDGKSIDLLGALTAAIGHGMGTVISCVSGRLAFHEAEGPSERYLLKREAPK